MARTGWSSNPSTPVERAIFEQPEGSDLQWFRWAGAEKLLFSMSAEVEFFGEEAQRTMLFVIDIKTRQILALDRQETGAAWR